MCIYLNDGAGLCYDSIILDGYYDIRTQFILIKERSWL